MYQRRRSSLGVWILGLLASLFQSMRLGMLYAPQGAGASPGDDAEDVAHLPPNPNRDADYDGGALRDIYLAGGCFWGVEAYMARVYGVAEVVSGYANGRTEDPSYQDVLYRNTGHAEAVRLRYDPARISLRDVLARFMEIIDPTAINRQGNDVGTQYRTGIYYADEGDLPVIREVLAEVQAQYERPLAVEVEPLDGFYPAEAYHQKYLEKNPGGYCHVDMSRLL